MNTLAAATPEQVRNYFFQNAGNHQNMGAPDNNVDKAPLFTNKIHDMFYDIARKLKISFKRDGKRG